MECHDVGNPFGSWLGFDNIGLAVLTVITTVSLEVAHPCKGLAC